MVLDYSDRRPVSKNRPKKKQTVGFLIFTVAFAVIVSFIAGFAGGWFFGEQTARKECERIAAAKAAEAPPSEAKPTGHDVPLTFYQTLPKGAKSVIGSGLNPGKASERKMAKAESQTKTPPDTSPDTPARNLASDEGTFCVQVASIKDKKEAETLKARLLAKGEAAYILESDVNDKGAWYRVRIGRRLKQSEADELAARIGNGALAIAE